MFAGGKANKGGMMFLGLIIAVLALSMEVLAGQKEKREPHRCQCGYVYEGAERHRTVPAREEGKEIELHYDGEPIGSGGYSQVHHATMFESGEDKGKCVALKFTILNKEKLEQNDFGTLSEKEAQENEWEMLNIFATELDAKRTKHVIKLFANGTFEQTNDSAGETTSVYMYTIMELGYDNYRGHSKHMITEWLDGNVPLNDERVTKAFVEVVLAVRDVHQKVIHLDMKPDNLLLVQEEDANGRFTDVLKAIDFGGSMRIPLNAQNTSTANTCLFYDEGVIYTEGFHSPEILFTCRGDVHGGQTKLTTKADIWSMGVMLYQLFLYDFQRQVKADKVQIRKRNINGNLRKVESFRDLSNWVSSYFLPLRVDKYQYVKPTKWHWEQDLRSALIWQNIIELLKFLFGIRKCCPKMFHLIIATLKHDPRKRPTAIGILAYLNNECRLAYQGDGDELGLLPGLTVKDMRQLLMKGPEKLAAGIVRRGVAEVFALWAEGNAVARVDKKLPLCDTQTKELSSAELAKENNNNNGDVVDGKGRNTGGKKPKTKKI